MSLWIIVSQGLPISWDGGGLGKLKSVELEHCFNTGVQNRSVKCFDSHHGTAVVVGAGGLCDMKLTYEMCHVFLCPPVKEIGQPRSSILCFMFAECTGKGAWDGGSNFSLMSPTKSTSGGESAAGILLAVRRESHENAVEAGLNIDEHAVQCESGNGEENRCHQVLAEPGVPWSCCITTSCRVWREEAKTHRG